VSGLDRLKEILTAALETPVSERAELLSNACGDDAGLRAEVERLLAAHERMGAFMETPAPAAVAAEPRLEPGRRIGAYEIVGLLGSGGSGTVYEALQERPHRRVALKVMRAGLHSDAALRRFLDEAEILARLRHPGIATVHEAGVHDADGTSLPFFAMEYIEEARSLLAYAEEERLDTRERLELIARICGAVHHGHQKRIVHRDLKPGNILVDASGQAKIIDFGIARAVDPDTPGERREIAGTLAYMSPEQLEPDETDVDVRSDVYSLGVVLYELLNGRLPYDVADTPITEAARRIREAPPAPSSRELGVDVSAILAKALAKDREERYVSAAALAADIRRHLTDHPVEAVPPGLPYQLRKFARRHRAAFVAATIVVFVSIGAAAVGGWLAWENDRARRAAELQAYRANVAAALAALRLDDVGEARQRLEGAPKRHRGWEWRHLRGRLDASLRTIRWPGNRIYAGALSRDGALLAASSTAARTGYGVRVWRMDTGAVLHTIATKERRVDALAFGPDSALLALGYRDGALELRDALTGRLERVLEGHPTCVNVAAFDPTGRRLATGSSDATIRLWDGATGDLVRTLRGHGDRVIGLCFGPDGKRLASGGREGTIRIWDLASGESTATLHGHEGSVESLAVSPDGSRLASGSRDRTVRLWDLQTGKALATWRGHAANVRAVAFGPDGRTVASASYDRTVRLWRSPEGRIASFRGHTNLVCAVAFLPAGERSVSLSADGTAKVWRVGPHDDVPILRGHGDVVTSIAFGPEGTLLASGSRDGSVRLWDVETRRPVGPPLRHEGRIESLAVGGSLLCCVGSGFPARVRSLPDGRFLRKLPVHAWLVSAGRRLHFVDTAGLHVWDPETDEPSKRLDLDGDRVQSLGVDRANRRVALGYSNGSIAVRDAESLELVAEAKVHEGWVTALSFGPADRRLATASDDRTVAVLDARSLAVLARLEGHTDRLEAVAFSPDGTRIATGGHDNTIRLWDAATGLQVAVFRCEQPTYALAWSPDGRRLASGGGAYDLPGVIRIWEAP
jgi:WD40 repeat protein